MNKKIGSILLWGALIIPLDKSDSWQILKFSNLPPHQIKFNEKGLLVNVVKSSSPLIHPLPQRMEVKALKVSGEIIGRLDLKGKTQGEKGADDFELRIGLVLQGNKNLNWAQRLVAADWIKKLHSLAPSQAGIEEILFLNAVQDKSLVSFERRHPLSDLLKEHYVWFVEKEGRFVFQHKFPHAQKTLALWLSIDGDDTRSEYQVLIDHIELQ